MSTETLVTPSQIGLPSAPDILPIGRSPEMVELENAFTRLRGHNLTFAEVALRLNQECSHFTISHYLIETFFEEHPRFEARMTPEERRLFLYVGASNELNDLYNRLHAAEQGLLVCNIDLLATHIDEVEAYREEILIETDEESYYPPDVLLFSLGEEQTE